VYHIQIDNNINGVRAHILSPSVLAVPNFPIPNATTKDVKNIMKTHA
jgi:hypothetical protein